MLQNKGNSKNKLKLLSKDNIIVFLISIGFLFLISALFLFCCIQKQALVISLGFIFLAIGMFLAYADKKNIEKEDQ